jgi:AcrR family transcriptional regulator
MSTVAAVDDEVAPELAEAGASLDGRRARRERNRAAVADAMLELLLAGEAPPLVEHVADRAGVSPASVFRYFEGIDDLVREAVERYFDRYASLFDVPQLGDGTQHERIERFVTARLRLHHTTAPIARAARRRADIHPAIAERLDDIRRQFAQQVRTQFAPELRAMPRGRADDVASMIDALTAFESWDLQTTSHARSDRLVRRAWLHAIAALLA